MNENFKTRINNYYSNIAKTLKSQADSAAIFPNKTDIGVTREKIYSEFLKLHLPGNCILLYGGFLFDMNRNESKQIDLIITSNKCPQYKFIEEETGKSFSCIDGTLAVVSVKSTLDKKQLFDSLDNFAVLPEKMEIQSDLYVFPNYIDWPFKIIYAHDGIDIKTIEEHINQYYIENPSIPQNKRPNLIHVLDKGMISRIGEKGGITRGGKPILPNSFFCTPKKDKINPDIQALATVVFEIQKNADVVYDISFEYGRMINEILNR